MQIRSAHCKWLIFFLNSFNLQISLPFIFIRIDLFEEILIWPIKSLLLRL